jgi:hypothetical protein
MDETARRRFESLYALSEQAWRDWDHKTKHEWKLSFGIWAALLASAAGFDKVRVEVPIGIIIAIGLVIFTIHLIFLWWVQIRLKDYRSEMGVLTTQMRVLAETAQVVPRHSRLGIFSPIIQVAITILVIFVFGFVCLGVGHSQLPELRKPSRPGSVQCDSVHELHECQYPCGCCCKTDTCSRAK